jgi:hypothetical protein
VGADGHALFNLLRSARVVTGLSGSATSSCFADLVVTHFLSEQNELTLDADFNRGDGARFTP